MFGALGVSVSLSACGDPIEFEGSVDPLPFVQIETGAIHADSGFAQVWTELGPVAQSVCKESDPKYAAGFCDFELFVGSDLVPWKNAQMIVAANGKPGIHIGGGMAASALNQDQIAFILAHEAAHRIAGHSIGAANLKADREGAFSLALSPQKSLELEADVIGTILVSMAGFDPLQGAEAIKVFSDSRLEESTTHPSFSQRFAVVQATIKAREAGEQILWN